MCCPHVSRQRRHEGRPVPAADVQGRPGNDHHVLIHLGHIGQVHQAPVAAPAEMVGRQLLLRLLHCPTQGKLPLVGVIVQDMVLNLHIVDVSGLQHLDAACQRQDDALSLPALRPADGLGQLHGEHVVVHRLQQEVQRVHLVAVDGILGHLGDEYQHRLFVHLSDVSGCFHAVHIRHGDVQQDDVILRPIVLYQIHPAGKAGDFHLHGVGLPILPQKLRQLRTGFRFVLCNGDLQHGASRPSLIRKNGF